MIQNIIPLTFEIIVDGVTIFGAFLVRDTMVLVLDEVLPDRTSTIYSTIIYTLITIVVCVVFVCIIRRYITKLKNNTHYNPDNYQQAPQSFDLFD